MSVGKTRSTAPTSPAKTPAAGANPATTTPAPAKPAAATGSSGVSSFTAQAKNTVVDVGGQLASQALSGLEQTALDAAYAKLSSQSAAQPLLDALQIHDGASLGDFAKALAGDAKSAVQQGVDLSQVKAALAKLDPKVAAAFIQTVGAALPGPAGTLLQDAGFANALASDKSLPAAVSDLASGNLTQFLGEVGAQAPVAKAAAQALLRDPTVGAALTSIGLSASDVESAMGGLPDLIDLAQHAVNRDPVGALQSALKLGEDAPAISEELLAKLGQASPEPVKSLLGDSSLVKELVTDPKLHGAVVDLAQGDWSSALGALAGDSALQNTVAQKLWSSATLQPAFKAVGLGSAKDLVGAGKALGELYQAGSSAISGNSADAITHLAGAASDAPGVVEKGITTLGSKIPGLAGALLGDPAVAKDLVENPALHDAVAKLAGGQLEDGLKELLGDGAGKADVAAVIAKDSSVMQRLAPLGITSASDLSQLGTSLVDALQLADDVRAGNAGQSVRDLTSFAKDLPAGMRTRVLDAVASKLPAGISQAAQAIAPMLGDPNVDEQLAQAADAIAQRNPAGVAAALARVGEDVAADEPQSAVAFLDELSHLPGGLGKLFASHELNQQVVDSGALGDVFKAAEDLALGDGQGAMKSLGSAGVALVTSGDKITVAGKQLPVSQEGVEALKDLSGRFVDLLPAGVKAQVLAVAGQAASAAIPLIGPALNTVADGYQLGKDVVNGQYNVGTLTDAGQVLVDLGSFNPALAPVAAGGKLVLGLVKTVNEAALDVEALKKSFLG